MDLGNFGTIQLYFDQNIFYYPDVDVFECIYNNGSYNAVSNLNIIHNMYETKNSFLRSTA